MIHRIRSLRFTALLIVVAALLAPAAASTAQDMPTTILVRDFACDAPNPASPWEECDPIWGITYTVEADGVEVEGSPYTTQQDMGIGHGIGVEVPTDATTVTLTATAGVPSGYIAAAGYDPYSAAIADLPEVGFGGESTGPGIDMIYVLMDAPDDVGTGDDDADTGDDAGDAPVTLPNTGAGSTDGDLREAATTVLMVSAVLLAIGASVMRRAPVR